LSETAIKQMSSDQTGGLLGPNSGYGQGWQLKQGTQDFPSAGSFGHRGARGTHMWIDPTNQLIFVLLMEHGDDLGKKEGEIYQTFLKAAVEKYGTSAGKKSTILP
jgi:CubicO group peptidase (beta-lactamase class C family)